MIRFGKEGKLNLKWWGVKECFIYS
jgi:hypothetical protein